MAGDETPDKLTAEQHAREQQPVAQPTREQPTVEPWVEPTVEQPTADEAAAQALAARIRAAGAEPAAGVQGLGGVAHLPVRVRRQAEVVRLRTTTRPPFPVVVRRAALAAREAFRNPMVAASATAAVGVAAQVGLRLLEHRVGAKAAAAQVAARTASQQPQQAVRSWARISETRTVITEHRVWE